MTSLVSRLVFRYRQRTWRRRALPSFLIIGAQKAGTSSLAHYMRQHPQLIRAWRKEAHFFDGRSEFLDKPADASSDQFLDGERCYRAYFPLASRMKHGQQCFEATPSYLCHPLVPERIVNMLPQVRVIMLLRNPTKRAVSHYFHNARNARDPLPLMDAMLSEQERIRDSLERHDYSCREFRHFSYKFRGLYLEQIQRYQQLIPRERMLILDSNKLNADPLAMLRRAFEFVGVDPDFKVPRLGARNVGHVKSESDPEVLSYLDAYFKPHNEALRAQLGIDFGW